MKLIVTDYGDQTVGIFPESWVVEAPHDGTEEEGRELFRELILQAYSEFCEGRMTAEYDYEIEAKAKEELDATIRGFDEELSDELMAIRNSEINYGDVDFNNM